MVLLLAKPLSRDSVDRDYDGHWPAQTLRAGSPGFNAEGTELPLAGSGGTDQSRLRGVGAESESCTGSGEVEAGTFPLPCLRTSHAMIGVDFLVSGSSRCFANVKFRFRCSLADCVTALAEQTAGEVLEPACF
jgi:hypothetical protein